LIVGEAFAVEESDHISWAWRANLATRTGTPGGYLKTRLIFTG
jgi:hypothetical protein